MNESEPTPSPLSGPEFREMVTPLGNAMNEGRFDDARSIMLEAFQYVAEHAVEDTHSDDAAECEAEQRRDWRALERLYVDTLMLENAIPTLLMVHWKLGKLYRFLGQDEKATEHGRRAFDLARGHEIEMVRVMATVRFAELAHANDALEVEHALRSSLSSLPVGPLHAHFRAQALIEIANVRRAQDDVYGATELIDEAFAVVEPQQALAVLPGHQSTIARAWQVRALAQAAIGDREAAVAACENAIAARTTMRNTSTIESQLDADADSRFFESAAGALASIGETGLAREILSECSGIRSEWGLPPLNASGTTDK